VARLHSTFEATGFQDKVRRVLPDSVGLCGAARLTGCIHWLWQPGRCEITVAGARRQSRSVPPLIAFQAPRSGS
jgi:hypothetical protein